MLTALLLALHLCGAVIASTNFRTCQAQLQAGMFGQFVQGAVDAGGNQVSNVSQAVGLTYEMCNQLCGSGSEAFDQRLFAQQLAAWLLPWLALISQLPYGANDALKNFESMILAVGSPMLAAYSLALAVSSNRWMVERFRRNKHRNGFLAARVMSSLQQVLISSPKEDRVPPSLIENDEWWQKLAHGLDYAGSQWTLAAIMSMVYVGLAYILTWMNTLNSDSSDTEAYPSGQSLGSLWLSLLPIVIGYLQLSPKSDSDRISAALDHANESYFIAADKDQPDLRQVPQTIIIQTERRDLVDEDRICPSPICFYTRFYAWFWVVVKITGAFEQYTSDHSRRGIVTQSEQEVPEYCSTEGIEDDTHYYDLVNIYIKSVMLAVFLQWGTTGAAIMAMYLTPTRGLGCRSGSHLLYACLSTLVWLFSAVSAMLAHSHATSTDNSTLRKFIGGLSIVLRQTAKLVATLNTAWIFTSTFLQFSNAESNCYCKSVRLTLGSAAYASLVMTSDQTSAAKSYWVGGIVMASGTALVFVIAINVLMKRPQAPVRF